jgi:hypothetical protein
MSPAHDQPAVLPQDSAAGHRRWRRAARRLPGLALAIPAEEVKLKTDMNIYGVHELPVTLTETKR